MKGFNFLSTGMIAMLAMCLAAAAQAGPKTTICHVPPDNPDNPETLRVGGSALDDHLAHGDLLGACPPTAAELDPPEVRVDLALAPPAPTIEGINGGPPRPLVRMNSEIGAGYQFDFVANEVTLITDDPADLADFQSRWPATILRQVELPNPGGGASTWLYLLSVDPSEANTGKLERDLPKVSPQLHGQHQVSSEAGLQLLAVLASEARRHGLNVGLNVLVQSNDIARRSTEEAAMGDDIVLGALNYAYSSDGFQWPQTRHEANFPSGYAIPNDTGAAEAIRVVGAAGRLGNRVRAMIADGGFYPNEDFTPFASFGDLRTDNPDPTGCGAGAPPAPGTVCAAHGTHVALAGFGIPDNGFGTFGPGGPVTDLIVLQSPSIDAVSIIDFVVNSIPDALAQRPRLINLSFSFSVPGGWCFIACEPLDVVTGWLNSLGILVVAAAGNDGIDVDATDTVCVLGCATFEEAAIMPCENDGVLCVGANNAFQTVPTDYSNFGSNGADGNSVDIYAPGDLYSVNAIAAEAENPMPVDDLEIINGTSFATPFTSGVLTLAMAANPALSSAQVRDCLLSTAYVPFVSTGWRSVNAVGTVACAMGESHPFVEIVTPAEGAVYTRAVEAVELRANADDYEDGTLLTVNWTSSLDGSLGSSAAGAPLNIGSLALQLGEHQICATTSDISARSAQHCVTMRVISAAPNVTILQPRNADGSPAEFIQASTIILSGTATDPDDPDPTDIEWRLRNITAPPGSTVVSTSLNDSLSASSFPPGDYSLSLTATDPHGIDGFDAVTFSIIANPDNLPPFVTIRDPDPGETVFSTDGGPVAFDLDATVWDEEDGAIPFDQISWFVSTNGAPEVPLVIESFEVCVRFIIIPPDPPTCVELETRHRIMLGPDASDTNTRHDIKARVQDGDGNENQESNGRVTVFVTQFI